MTLRDGSNPIDVNLDRIYELDWRSLNYPVSQAIPVAPLKDKVWSVDHWLDQGPDGACVGFSFAHELSAQPWRVEGMSFTYALGVYHDAQRIDQWPGGSYPGANPFYEGTSILAGAKVCRNRGYYSSFWWALDLEELVRAVSNFGPCVLGIDWYEGMYNPDREGFLQPKGRLVGGHAVVISGVTYLSRKSPTQSSNPGCMGKLPKWITKWMDKKLPVEDLPDVPYFPDVPDEILVWADVDRDRSYVTIHNSWGQSWGDNGTAKLSLNDLAFLLSQQGDACFPEYSPEHSQ